MRGRDARGRPVELRHESANPRGWWLPCEPRTGVTDFDPPRYKRYTLAQLQGRGEADPGYTTDADTVTRDLHDQIQAAIRSGDFADAPAMTKHTRLGRMREAKQAAYYQRREDLAGELEIAGLDDDEVDDVLQQWDHLANYRTVQVDGPRGPEVAVYGPDDQVLAAFRAEDLYRAAAEAAGELEELESHLAQEQEIRDLVEALEDEDISMTDLGMTEADLLGDIDLVRESIAGRARDVRMERGAFEDLDLDDFPF